MRSAGLGNRILDEGLRYAKEKNASFLDFISLDGHVGKVTLIKFIKLFYTFNIYFFRCVKSEVLKRLKK